MPTPPQEPQDWADRHVAAGATTGSTSPSRTTWRRSWCGSVGWSASFRRTTQEALAEVGLQEFEYDTLHHLMISDTPGLASPSALATSLEISGAGMSGRLDTLEKAGWVRRHASPDDRRRVQVEVTESGTDQWRRAMDLRGRAEDEVVHALDERERAVLAQLLKRMTLSIEDQT